MALDVWYGRATTTVTTAGELGYASAGQDQQEQFQVKAGLRYVAIMWLLFAMLALT